MAQGHEVQQAGKLGQGQAEAAPPTQLRPLQSPRSWCASRDLSVGGGPGASVSLGLWAFELAGGWVTSHENAHCFEVLPGHRGTLALGNCHFVSARALETIAKVIKNMLIFHI